MNPFRLDPESTIVYMPPPSADRLSLSLPSHLAPTNFPPSSYFLPFNSSRESLHKSYPSELKLPPAAESLPSSPPPPQRDQMLFLAFSPSYSLSLLPLMTRPFEDYDLCSEYNALTYTTHWGSHAVRRAVSPHGKVYTLSYTSFSSLNAYYNMYARVETLRVAFWRETEVHILHASDASDAVHLSCIYAKEEKEKTWEKRIVFNCCLKRLYAKGARLCLYFGGIITQTLFWE